MERILTTHVGSLVRPESLQPDLQALERQEAGYDENRFWSNYRTSVAEVIEDQVATGIDLINDGEFSKSSWIRYLFRRLNGIELRYSTFDPAEILSAVPAALYEQMAKRDGDAVSSGRTGSFDVYTEISKFVPFFAKDYAAGGEAMTWHCTGPISYDPTEIDIHLSTLTGLLKGMNADRVFVNTLSPASVYYLVDDHYGDEEKFVAAIAEALRVEYRRIVDAGFQLHVDDAVMWHQYSAFAMAGRTELYEPWANLRVDALNYALEGIPQERIRYHICSGSAHGPKIFDPSLREILPVIMRVRWGMLLFEQGNVGHEHEWELWRDVALPDDRILVPGVVTHHTEMVEHPDLVAQRIVRMCDIVGRERVIAGTDCGFAQSTYIGRVNPWTQWAKLRALVEGARIASERLW